MGHSISLGCMGYIGYMGYMMVGINGGLQHFNMLADCHTTFILFAAIPCARSRRHSPTVAKSQ